MKAIPLFLANIIAIFVFSSFKREPLKNSEINIIQDTTGCKTSKLYYDNGKINVMDISIMETRIKLIWYENGQLKSQSQFYKGIPIGTFTEWHENGQKMSEGSYSFYTDTMGIKLKSTQETESYEGFIDFTDVPSQIKNKIGISYKYPRTGEWKYWYKSGQLKQICYYKTYKADEINPIETKEGKWQFYNDKGVLIKEIIYINDKIKK